MDKKIVKIAGFIFENHCKLTENEIINNLKITKNDFDKFIITFSPNFATHVNHKWHLTPSGVQLYFNLKQQNQQQFFNAVLTAATVVLAIFSITQTLKL
ncbi:hypothetical protein KKB44_01725 [Candidatus Micrarchaeota archaeon]|nr:hypothetical protein [Candidatus Micrarchaeota archaeon]